MQRSYELVGVRRRESHQRILVGRINMEFTPYTYPDDGPEPDEAELYLTLGSTDFPYFREDGNDQEQVGFEFDIVLPETQLNPDAVSYLEKGITLLVDGVNYRPGMSLNVIVSQVVKEVRIEVDKEFLLLYPKTEEERQEIKP